MANGLLDLLTDVARSQNPNAPAVKYGYASEIFPGLLSGPETLSDEELAQNNQVWDRLGRGANASNSGQGASPQAPRAPRAPAPQSPSPAYPLEWQARAQGINPQAAPAMNPPNPEVSTHRNFWQQPGPEMPPVLLAPGQSVPPTFGPSAAQPKFNAPDTLSLSDIGQSLLTGAGQGAAKTLGLPGQIKQIASQAPWAPKQSMLDGLVNKYGPLFGMNHLPNQEEMLQIAQNKFPQLTYQPQTRAGQVAQAAGRYLPSTLTRGANNVMTGMKAVGGMYPWQLGALTSLNDERNQ